MFVLVIALLATGLATAYITYTSGNRGRLRFENAVQFTTQHIRYDLNTYVSLLRGTQGLFAASDNVTPTEFRIFVEHLDLPTRYPGVAGLGFCPRVAGEEKTELTARMRREGFSEFHIWPESPGPQFLPVIHLEPLGPQQKRVIGYDLQTDPVRRAAMQRACDTGQPIASGKTPLTPETGEPSATGFYLFVPVFHEERACNTPEERRAALDGFVYSPLLATVLLGHILKNNLTVDVRFFDGEATDENLLYDSRQSRTQSSPPDPPRFSSADTFEIAGHAFSVQMTPGPALASDPGSELPALTALAGLALSVLLYSVTASLAKARAIAEQTAADLYQGEQRRARRARHLALRADIGTILTTPGNTIREVLQACTEAMTRQLDLAFVRVWTLSLDGKLLELQASAGLYTHLHGPHGRIGVGQLKIGRIAQQRTPQIINDLANDPQINDPAWARAQRLTAFAGYPLLVEGRLVGVLGLFSHETLAEDTLDAVAGLAELVAQGIERKRAEQRVLEQKRELEDFVSIVAHDLKHPVVSVQGLLGLLRQETAGQLDESGRENLEMALSECGRMKGIIAQLGHIARIGSTEVRAEPVRLRQFLESIVLRFAGTIQEVGASVSVESPDVTALLPRVQVDEALDNLITNALQYGCAGQDRCIALRCVVDEGTVAISVQDHGPGIEPRFHERVFEMFRRLDPAGPVSGTGVGLTAVHRLIKRIGGTVMLDSAAGQGATFTIRFPVQVLNFEPGNG